MAGAREIQCYRATNGRSVREIMKKRWFTEEELDEVRMNAARQKANTGNNNLIDVVEDIGECKQNAVETTGTTCTWDDQQNYLRTPTSEDERPLVRAIIEKRESFGDCQPVSKLLRHVERR